jgi:predicted N-acetyltransferase YhbS
MELIIRQEKKDDYNLVERLVKEAFETEEHSDHTEHLLVERIRNSDAFIPELSIIAQLGNEIVGHILLTKINIKNSSNSYESLALAPISVKSKYQKRGIGGRLIAESHEIAKSLGYKSIILLGHEKYYPKFGYQQANKFGIRLPYDVPEENCMVIELFKDSLKNISGLVEYSSEFNDIK